MTELIAPVDWLLILALVFLFATCAWLWYLYIHEYYHRRIAERDNYRLIGKLGQFQGVTIGTPPDTYHPTTLNPESNVPPAFRMKRPIPPPGWKPEKGVDEGVR